MVNVHVRSYCTHFGPPHCLIFLGQTRSGAGVDLRRPTVNQKTYPEGRKQRAKLYPTFTWQCSPKQTCDWSPSSGCSAYPVGRLHQCWNVGWDRIEPKSFLVLRRSPDHYPIIGCSLPAGDGGYDWGINLLKVDNPDCKQRRLAGEERFGRLQEYHAER